MCDGQLCMICRYGLQELEIEGIDGRQTEMYVGIRDIVGEMIVNVMFIESVLTEFYLVGHSIAAILLIVVFIFFGGRCDFLGG